MESVNRNLFVSHAHAKYTTNASVAVFTSLRIASYPMPPRRKSTRRNDMSDIEDDATTSRQQKDDVEDSDGEPVNRKRIQKRGKGKRRARKEAEDSDSDEAIEVASIPDQPLKRDQLGKLLGLAEDWDKVAERIKRPFPMFGMAAGGLADLGDEDAIEV